MKTRLTDKEFKVLLKMYFSCSEYTLNNDECAELGTLLLSESLARGFKDCNDAFDNF